METHTEGLAHEEAVSAEPESRRATALRHGRRARLYAWAVIGVATLAMLIALVIANVRSVKIDWVFSSGHASLVWIVMGAAVLGWLLGIATCILFRYRTRKPQV
jgi:uncharacterized integral membrane protein